MRRLSYLYILRISLFMSPKRSTQIVRFILVGMSNALITYIIYVVMRWAHFLPGISNAIGYLAALVNSFIWSKIWVFQTHKTNLGREIFYFCVAFLLAYGCQFIFFKTMIFHADINEYLVQFLGLFIYGAVNFIMNRKITFKHQEKESL